ncbi:hypothetical protein OAK17_04085 [Alphaproteobacteria bacterium]|nr:hypothetical protein [Alphaproteobacteria bacterium]
MKKSLNLEVNSDSKSIIPNKSSTSYLAYKYLKLMEDRDLDNAKKMLSPSFSMIFPSNKIFYNYKNLIEYGAKRQKSVKKKFLLFDEINNSKESIIYVSGYLYGEAINGECFKNIRFIDRFSLKDDLFVDQLVWNEMGEFDLGFKESLNSLKFKEGVSVNNFKSEALEIIDNFNNKIYNNDPEYKKYIKESKFKCYWPGEKSTLSSNKLFTYLSKRYLISNKEYYSFDEIKKNKEKVIYCYGRMSGTLKSGVNFQGIRFIEKFIIEDKKIIYLSILDDLGEYNLRVKIK